MMRFSLRTIVTSILTVILVLATSPVFLAAAQTPAADHEAHHPGTPAAGAPASAAGAPQAAAATTDPCAAITSTAPSGKPQAGMMGTPAMSGGGMADMMGQFDLMFIDMMIPHHAGAVAMAQVALSRAEHPELRALAEQIIASQSAEIEQMQAWREQWFPVAPAMPMEEMMGMMGGMMSEMMGGEMGQMMGEMMGEMMPDGMMPGGMPGTPGAGPGPGGMGMMMNMGQEIADLCATTEGFDLAFIDAMIPHHQMAVMMATMATMRAEHPELQTLAQTMVDEQQREIEQMQTWRAAWSGSATPAR
jgi:uncharacterized protein (DUF305 family)